MEKSIVMSTIGPSRIVEMEERNKSFMRP